MKEICSRAGVAFSRFVVRALCDDTGQPSTARILIYPWLTFSGFFYVRALGSEGAAAIEAIFGVTAVSMVILLWCMALKLGISFFVPLAETVTGVFTRVARTATNVLERAKIYDGGPDRTVGLTDPGGELFRRPRRPAPVLGGDDPYTDDERDE